MRGSRGALPGPEGTKISLLTLRQLVFLSSCVYTMYIPSLASRHFERSLNALLNIERAMMKKKEGKKWKKKNINNTACFKLESLLMVYGEGGARVRERDWGNYIEEDPFFLSMHIRLLDKHLSEKLAVMLTNVRRPIDFKLYLYISKGSWLFLHYNNILHTTGECFSKVEQFARRDDSPRGSLRGRKKWKGRAHEPFRFYPKRDKQFLRSELADVRAHCIYRSVISFTEDCGKRWVYPRV